MDILVKSYLKEAMKTSENLLEDKLKVVGEIVVSEAKPLTPVKYGRAKGSITWAKTKDKSKPDAPATMEDAVTIPTTKGSVKIGSRVEYFKFLELGTKHMKRFVPLRLGLLKARPKIQRVLSK